MIYKNNLYYGEELTSIVGTSHLYYNELFVKQTRFNSMRSVRRISWD